ncbi:MAG: DUF4302 domain-containing protein [Prevotella sp.]|nr:DUF4302 domain-containing protein [Prevotella sp.]
MKKLYSIFSLLVSIFAFTACTPEVDDKFSETPTDRVEETSNNTRDILKAAPNGWRIEYYAATTYGGYNVFAKFDENNVTVASEKVGSSHNAGFGEDGKLVTATSHYKIEASQGIVLSFDEYNNIFHYFSDPANPDYGEKGEGMEGDFEFRVQSATPEKVELVGKKHQAKVVMYPVEDGKTWEDYVNEANATKSFMASRSYQFVVDGSEREISVTTSYRRLVFTWLNDSEEKQQVVAPFIITKDGYKLYRTVDVDGTEISSILKGNTEEYFVVEGNENARLYTYVPSLKETFEEGMWFITYEDLSPFARPYWDTMRDKLATAGPNNTRNRLYWALLGTYLNRLAFHMQAGGDYCYQGITVTQTDEDGNEIQIKWKNSQQNAAGRLYHRSYGMDQAMIPLMGVGTRGRTFTLSTDNKRHPSYLILTDKNEPANVIKLWAEEKNYPYGDLDADEK